MRSMILQHAAETAIVREMTSSSLRRPSSYVNTYALVANTAQTITIPAGTAFVMFNSSTSTGTANIPFWVCDSSVLTPAVVPSTTVTTGLSCEFMPTMYNVGGFSTEPAITALSVISNVAGFLYVSFYSDPSNYSAT